MKDTASGRDSGKTYSANVHGKAGSSTSCAFCWFVLNVYPTLKGMTPRDDATFREHLKQSHGLADDISV